MKKLFYITLLVLLCSTLNPVFANDPNKLDSDDNGTTDFQREVSTREINIDEATLEKRKNSKKKKGQRNVKVQPSKEEDENIILELD